jgi:hypothetical protein
MSDIAAQRQKMIADFEVQVEVLKEYKQQIILGSEVAQFVVLSADDLALNFEISEDSVVHSPRVVKLQNAQRFERREAEYLAKQVFNGRNEQGHAEHLVLAVSAEIVKLEELVASLKAV